MSNWKLLVVDDEPGILRAIERILSGSYDVTACDSSEIALDLARRVKPDLAVVDIRMPELNGFQLLQQLKEFDPEMEVILMTGSVDESDEKLVRAIKEKAFYFITKPFDREVLLALVDRCLEMKRLQRAERAHSRQMQSQLAAARAFQESMLPPRIGKFDEFGVHASYYACEDVAGDYFDYAVSGKDHLTVLVADVVGHGASAAMLTAIVRSAFHHASADGYPPATIAGSISTMISAFAPDLYLTLMCARLSRSDSSIEYVNAGHPPGLLITSDGQIVDLPPTGALITPLQKQLTWETGRLDLPPDSLLVMYSDGVIDVAPDQDLFGIDRLYSLIGKHCSDRDCLVENIHTEIAAFQNDRSLADDLTLLSVWPVQQRQLE